MTAVHTARAGLARRVRHGLGRAVLRAPAIGKAPVLGRAARARLLAEAERRLRRGGSLADVERALTVFAAAGGDTRTWSLLTRVRAARGDRAGAAAAGQRLAERPDADPDGLLAWYDAVAKASDPALAHLTSAALDRLAEVRPATRGQARRVLDRLRAAGRTQQLVEVHERASAAGIEVSAPWLRDALAVVALERAWTAAPTAGPEVLDAEVARLVRSGPDGARVAGRFLIDHGDLVRAADVYRDLTKPQVPSGLLLGAVQAARRAGQITGPYVLAEVLHKHHPTQPQVAAAWEFIEDEHRLFVDGFPVEPAKPPTYDPVDRRVFYVLHTTLPYGHAGYSVRSHGLATGLRARGWDVAGVSRLDYPLDRSDWPAGQGVPDHDVIEGVTYHRLLSGNPRPRRAPRGTYARRFGDALEQLARRERPALLHAASFAPNGLAAHVAARRLGLPVVYEVRGLQDLAYVSMHPERRDTERHELMRRLEVEAALRADRVLVITRAIRDEFARDGVPEERMVVVPNGVHAADYTPRPRDRALEAELGLAGKTVLGYVGNIAFYEGIELLLEAAARLRGHRDDIAVLVVGYGDAEQACRDTVDRLGLHDLVRMPGRVPSEEAVRYQSLIDVFVVPRRGMPVTELVSPLKLFQPMAMGIPTVVSSCAALTEIVQDGVTGLVHDKESVDSLVAVLERLLDNPELRRRLGEVAIDWVRRERDWSVITARVEEVYADVLAQAAAAR